MISMSGKRLFLKEVKKMARDKAKDDELFNCNQQYEIDYVAGLYGEKVKDEVKQFIKDGCEDGTIKDLTHAELYQLIKDELDLDM